ncbi:MAG TPA: hypothetical protein VHV53_11030 [Solirubrobacterales bacterium]|jgi:hypothetical protein|nr:hypothetical protein [Solirubrobacterales bacterium]
MASAGAPPLDATVGRAGKAARASRRLPLPSTVALESTAVFLFFGAAYFIVGYRVVVDLHLVNFDALARLAHAYFVWWNDPPKLASVGFVWPPMQTLVFLPFTLIRPLATSLAALPAMSATFMAAMMLVLNRTLAWTGMRWFARYPLLLAFGFNPMILYYGANGMAEAVYLFFLVVGVYFLLRWDVSGEAHLLAFVGVALALSLLSRYEILPFAIVIGVAVVLITVTRRPRKSGTSEVEASLLLYLAPIAYAGAAWLFFNWLIVGNPLSFFNLGATSADIGSSQQEAAGLPIEHLGLVGLTHYLIDLNLVIFPLTVLVVPALLLTAAVRRNLMSVVLAALVATNAVVTAYLFIRSGSSDSNLLQLRYNMRAMPIALMGVGWLYYMWRPAVARIAIWGLALAVLAVSIPVTWKTMETYPYQYEENVFLRALETGEDQEGNVGISGYPIGIQDEREMADYISEHVPAGDTILTDDAQTLGVMLLNGHPDRFFDRIDYGEERWAARLDEPYGKVDYLLVSTNQRCRAPCEDLVRVRYPGILDDKVPGMHVVFRNSRYVLIKVEAHPEAADRNTGAAP